jgi:hypothetical protein
MRWLVLHFLQIEVSAYDSCVAALFALAIGYRICSYLILKCRIRFEVSM